MTLTGYDKVPYDSLPQRQGNLRLLETIADLYDLKPVDVRQCRVLELGTGIGKTLIAQAGEFPETRFIGIDLSVEQIETGRRLVEELGLSNVELRQSDILDVDDSCGEFDYIIVHGIYSWVPPDVQDKILSICRTNLSDRGIAMISYNTYPGWHPKEMIRNLLLFHVRHGRSHREAGEEIREAKNVLDSFVALKAVQGGHDAAFYRKIGEEIRRRDDDYIYHEYLEPDNRPCYFSEFCRRLKEHRLEHLSDLDWEYFGVCLLQENFRRFVEHVEAASDIEQYLDFFVNRTFRSGVVCRERRVPATMRSDLAERYFMRIPRPVGVERTPGGGWRFHLSGSDSAQIDYPIPSTPLSDAVVSLLSDIRPGYFSLASFRQRLDRIAPGYDPNELVSFFGRLIHLGLLKIALRLPGRTAVAGTSHPFAPGFTRSQMERDQKIATNPDFDAFLLSPLQAWLVSRSDGTRSVSEMADFLRNEIRQDVRDWNIPIAEEDSLPTFLERSLEELRKLHLIS